MKKSCAVYGSEQAYYVISYVAGPHGTLAEGPVGCALVKETTAQELGSRVLTLLKGDSPPFLQESDIVLLPFSEQVRTRSHLVCIDYSDRQCTLTPFDRVRGGFLGKLKESFAVDATPEVVGNAVQRAFRLCKTRSPEEV